MLYFAMLRKTIWIRVVWVTQRRPGHDSSSSLSRSVDFQKIGIRKYSTPHSCVPGRASYPRFREVTMRNQLEAIYRATFNPFHRVAIERSTASYPAGIFRMRVGYSLTGVVSPFEMNETVRISLSSPPLTVRRSLKTRSTLRIVCGNYLELVNTVGVWGLPFVVDWKRAREFFKTEKKREKESLSSFLINFFFRQQFRIIESLELFC